MNSNFLGYFIAISYVFQHNKYTNCSHVVEQNIDC